MIIQLYGIHWQGYIPSKDNGEKSARILFIPMLQGNVSIFIPMLGNRLQIHFIPVMLGNRANIFHPNDKGEQSQYFASQYWGRLPIFFIPKLGNRVQEILFIPMILGNRANIFHPNTGEDCQYFSSLCWGIECKKYFSSQ